VNDDDDDDDDDDNNNNNNNNKERARVRIVGTNIRTMEKARAGERSSNDISR
jgi:hypothetical protein